MKIVKPHRILITIIIHKLLMSLKKSRFSREKVPAHEIIPKKIIGHSHSQQKKINNTIIIR